MKKFLILLILNITLFAYDKLVVATQASIYPKIILLDTKFQDKLIDGRVVITIVYQSGNEDEAIDYREFIKAKFGNDIKGRELVVEVVSYAKFNDSIKSTALILLNKDTDKCNKIVDYAIKHNIILFSYDYSLFKHGALFFATIEDKTNIYLNKEKLKNYKINFRDVLYQITKEYSE